MRKELGLTIFLPDFYVRQTAKRSNKSTLLKTLLRDLHIQAAHCHKHSYIDAVHMVRKHIVKIVLYV